MVSISGEMTAKTFVRNYIGQFMGELFTILIPRGAAVVEMLGQLRHVAALREVLKESTVALVHKLSRTLGFFVQLPPELKAVALHATAKRLSSLIEAF